jgi:predicted RND superfamily exporter protein
MNRLFDALRPLIRAVVRRAAWVVGAAALLTFASLYLATGLGIDTNFANLLPADYPSVQALGELKQTVGGEDKAAVAVTSPSFEANKRFIEDLIPKVLQAKSAGYDEAFFRRAVYRRDADFLRDHALYFASDAELDSLETFLDDKIRKAKQEANPFALDLQVEGAADTSRQSSDERLRRMYRDLTVSKYTASADSTVLVVKFYPSGAQTNVDFITDAYAALERQVEALNPSSYHAQMDVTLAGRLLRQKVEVEAIRDDVLSSFGYGMLAVLLFVTLYFFYKAYRARTGGAFDARVLAEELARTPVLALIIALPLLMSLAWTGAAGYLALGDLNLMTATLGLVLFGLGIDFGIHFYARYTEVRAEGASVAEAAERTFASTGQAIAVGAFTTAAGLFVLGVADFKGFSEFGFLAGIGVLFALLAMTLVLPALLSLLEGVRLLDLGPASTGAHAPRGGGRFPAARPIAGGSAAAAVLGLALALLGFVNFQYDFSKLEPEYTAYDAKEDVVERATSASQAAGGDKPNNPAYILTDDRSEVAAVTKAVRKKMERDTLSPTIHSVESLQERFPLAEDSARAKLDRIAGIRSTLNENKYLRRDSSRGMQRLRRAASTRRPIPTDSVPGYLKGRFTSKQGEVGGFVMVYPSVGLSDGQKSMAFRADVGAIETEEGRVYHAGSTSLVAAAMLELMIAEAPWMVLATFVIVASLMWLNFRSVRWALLALVPLVVGVIWMLLVMALTGVQLNFYNLVVLPAVLGIGNDAGVHLVHRYREEGPGSIIQVLRSTGEHVAMGSLTTMIGFGGLLLSFHPGLRSIGLLAVIGIGTTLVSALVFLPALLQWLENRGQLVHASGRAAFSGNGKAEREPAQTKPTRERP